MSARNILERNRYIANLNRLGTALACVSDSAVLREWLAAHPDLRITPAVNADGRITLCVVKPSSGHNGIFHVFYSASALIEHAYQELNVEAIEKWHDDAENHRVFGTPIPTDGRVQ